MKITNNVSNLSSLSKRKIRLQQSEGRKNLFMSLRDKLVSEAPDLGRDILLTDEMYDSNILKVGQESKKERN